MMAQRLHDAGDLPWPVGEGAPPGSVRIVAGDGNLSPISGCQNLLAGRFAVFSTKNQLLRCSP
jgi:hypothetical protein